MSEKESIGILVGAAPLGAEKQYIETLLNREDAVSVAADGGLSFFADIRKCPDAWFGDGDSLGEEALRKAGDVFPDLLLSPCPKEKDDTDLRLAMLHFKALGIREILIFGGLGGDRPDHTIANIQLLHEFAEEGIRVFVVSEKEYLYVLTKGEKVRYKEETEGILSVFSLTDECSLAIRDLKYEFEGVINNRRVFTVSNEFNKKGGTVEIFEGTALIVRPVSFETDREHFSIGLF